ncbi:hypothetical protein J1N35_043642, partial [Gossypium stocksii]
IGFLVTFDVTIVIINRYERLESDLKLAKTRQTLEDQVEIKRLRETIREANLKLARLKKK